MSTPKLMVYFDDSDLVRLPGWQIKESSVPHTPVGVVSGTEGNARSKNYASLFAAAPELLEEIKYALRMMPLGSRSRSDWAVRVAELVKKAEGRTT